MEHESRHQCLIYAGQPSTKLGLIASIIKIKLLEGYRCLYLNSATMVAGMRSTLAAIGIDVTSEIAKERLVLSSDSVLLDGVFDCEMMLRKLENYLDAAIQDGYKGLWASGDMTWEFGAIKNFSKLMEYECGLEELFHKRKELHGICQYHQNSLPKEALLQGLLIHPSIVVNETLNIINPHYLKTSWPTDQSTINKLDKMVALLCGGEQNQ